MDRWIIIALPSTSTRNEMDRQPISNLSVISYLISWGWSAHQGGWLLPLETFKASLKDPFFSVNQVPSKFIRENKFILERQKRRDTL